MITEIMFLKVIELVLNEINDMTFNEHCEIISGQKKWEPRSWGLFENSFSERIVRRLSILEDVIGWEASYPFDVFAESDRFKLDLAYGYIDNYYFESVVEVKKWDGNNKRQFNIWEDIFKLYAYETNNNINVGKNKYVLVIYNESPKDRDEIMDIVNYLFVNPSVASLEYNAENLLGAFDMLLTELKWSRKSIDLLFLKYKKLFSEGRFIEFKREYLLHDVGENIFAFVLKLSC